MKSHQVIAAAKHDHWTGAESPQGEDPLLMRFREGLYEAQDFTGYPCMLRITWTYAHDGRTGMPSGEESDEMAEFENHLVQALEHDFHGVLAAVITENGTRQWIFYTSELAECARRITEMPQKEERYPIELVGEDDADWSYFRETIQTICGGVG